MRAEVENGIVCDGEFARKGFQLPGNDELCMVEVVVEFGGACLLLTECCFGKAWSVVPVLGVEDEGLGPFDA